MRLVFMGTPDFAVPTLDALVEAGHQVALVVAQPDQPAGRGMALKSPPVVARARELGLSFMQPRALKRGPFPEHLIEVRADLAVVIAYGRILPKPILETPRLGCINVHASLLPRWRGAAPIQAALLAGDTETGVCTQRMEEGLDVGPVYCVERTPIEPEETAGELHDRLAQMAGRVAVDTLRDYENRVPVPQDHAQATWAPKVTKADGEIHFDADAVALHRRVRAMTPWPGGWILRGDDAIKLLEVRPSASAPDAVPGTILSTQPLVVACGTGALELVTVQAPGRRPVSGAQYANGARLVSGGRW